MMHRRHLHPLMGMLWAATAPAWEAPPAFAACIDYHCDIQRPVSLTPAGWAEIRHLFTPAATSARDERRQIKQAVARLEQLVGENTENWRDLKENDGEGSELGQLDCIAESINTTRYLRLMSEDNLLKWHRISDRQRRSSWFFSAHWTAVIEQRSSQQHYAVDSWVNANGEPPIIQPMDAWRASNETGSEQDQ